MKSLWAPWRMKFIEEFHKKGISQEPTHCLFCTLQQQPKSIKSLVLFKGKRAFVVLNRYPYTNGHLMVVPKRHVADFESLSAGEHQDIANLSARAIKALKKISHPHGFNVGLNLGKAAGAGIEGHLHTHVVPRWVGDSNFMPVIGETRTLPEFVAQTYKKLARCFTP